MTVDEAASHQHNFILDSLYSRYINLCLLDCVILKPKLNLPVTLQWSLLRRRTAHGRAKQKAAHLSPSLCLSSVTYRHSAA